MNKELKEGIDRAAEANGRLAVQHMAKNAQKVRLHQGPTITQSWEHLPGIDGEVLVTSVIVHNHMGKPYIGRAYLRPHELECYDFDAGYLIAAGKAYRQLADDLTKLGLDHVRDIFSTFERINAPREVVASLFDQREKLVKDWEGAKRLSHEERLLDALNTGRVIICDQCHKPYGSHEKMISTAKGNLFQCPHCKNIVPKCTLEELHKSAKVLPEDRVYDRVRKRIQGILRWVEHKDGTITEDHIEELHSTWGFEDDITFCMRCKTVCLDMGDPPGKCSGCGAVMDAPAEETE